MSPEIQKRNNIELPPILDNRPHVRRRPAIYFGSTTDHGVVVVIDELVSNGIDLYLRGTATRVGITSSGDTLIYTDDGPGLPYDEPGPDGSTLAEHYLTNYHHTPTADEHAPHVHLLGHGVGLMGVNAVSEFFEVNTWRSGSLWYQRFQRGYAVEPPRVVEQGSGRGTQITFRIDGEVFSCKLPHPFRLRKMIFEAAHLIPGILLQCEQELFQAPRGLGDLAAINFNWSPGFGIREVPVFSCQLNDETIRINVGLIGHDATETHYRSWANGKETLSHGAHFDGLRDAIRTAKIWPGVAMIHVVMNQPQYAGPTRGQLRNPEVRKQVREAVKPVLREWCKAQGF